MDSTDIPAFATLAADPEIAALLAFDPAPGKVDRPDGWTPERQRELIARIADTGSPGRAVDAMDKNLSGAKHLYRAEGADSFRAAWKAAIALAEARRRAERAGAPQRPVEVPGITRPPRERPAEPGPLPGQIRNEHGEWEDRNSIENRLEEARGRIAMKLLRCRRLFLHEIAPSPGKRAAFEILTGLAVDWDRAERLEPQPDEPFNPVVMRQPDMVLTAENGWLGGLTHGPDRIAELQRDINEHRAEQGLEPVDWSESAESKTNDGEADASA
jgi:hypothetical protein